MGITNGDNWFALMLALMYAFNLRRIVALRYIHKMKLVSYTKIWWKWIYWDAFLDHMILKFSLLWLEALIQRKITCSKQTGYGRFSPDLYIKFLTFMLDVSEHNNDGTSLWMVTEIDVKLGNISLISWLMKGMATFTQ